MMIFQALRSRTNTKYVPEVTDVNSQFSDKIKGYYGVVKNSRVETFVNWLKANSQLLTKNLKNDLKNNRIPSALTESEFNFIAGYWLGIRYIASINRKSEQQAFFPINPDYFSPTFVGQTGFDFLGKRFQVAPDFLKKTRSVGGGKAILWGINIGIHEGTHALPAINNVKVSGGALSEFATYYSQSTFGLPLKVEDLDGGFYLGVRSSSKLLELDYEGKLPKDSKKFDHEYMSYLIGPYLKTYYSGKMDVWKYTRIKESSASDFYGDVDGKWLSKLSGIFSPTNWTDGLNDDKVKAKIEKVINKLKNDTLKDEKDFFKKFQLRMKEEFGEPFDENIPSGFASLENVRPQTLKMNEIVPKRKYG